MKRLDAMKQTQNWRARLKLAEKNQPGTKFDSLFEDAKLALKFKANNFPSDAKSIFECLGENLARWIERGESQTLHEIADSLNQWKTHRRKMKNMDHIREAVASLAVCFPTGKTESKGGKLIRRYSPILVRDVLNSLRQHNVPTDENTPKIIRRCFDDFGIPYDSTPGRRKKTMGQKAKRVS